MIVLRGRPRFPTLDVSSHVTGGTERTFLASLCPTLTLPPPQEIKCLSLIAESGGRNWAKAVQPFLPLGSTDALVPTFLLGGPWVGAGWGKLPAWVSLRIQLQEAHLPTDRRHIPLRHLFHNESDILAFIFFILLSYSQLIQNLDAVEGC